MAKTYCLFGRQKDNPSSVVFLSATIADDIGPENFFDKLLEAVNASVENVQANLGVGRYPAILTEWQFDYQSLAIELGNVNSPLYGCLEAVGIYGLSVSCFKYTHQFEFKTPVLQLVGAS